MQIFSFEEIKGMIAEEPMLASQYKRSGSSREIEMAARRLMIFSAQTPGYPLELLAAHMVAAAEAKRLLIELEASVTVEPNMDTKTALEHPIVFEKRTEGWIYWEAKSDQKHTSLQADPKATTT